jgi:prepilin-type N-terminal cleavage/methylation domain-containing protein
MIENNIAGIKSKRRKGFTLVELIVAVTVLVIGIAGVITVYHVGFSTSSRAHELTIAGIEAQLQMEKLVGRKWDTDLELIDWGDAFPHNDLWVVLRYDNAPGDNNGETEGTPEFIQFSTQVTVYIYTNQNDAEADAAEADENDFSLFVFRHRNIINISGVII